MIVLASGSPRRRQLLEMIGLEFRVVPPEVDESLGPAEQAEGYVTRLAREKATTVAGLKRGAVVLVWESGDGFSCYRARRGEEAQPMGASRRAQARDCAVPSYRAVRSAPLRPSCGLRTPRVPRAGLQSARRTTGQASRVNVTGP